MVDPQEAFEIFDIDGDGCITTNELGLALRSLGNDPSESELQSFIAEVGEGALIDFNTFDSIRGRIPAMSEQDLIQSFRVFDKEDNGTISYLELHHVLSNMGEQMAEEEVDAVLRNTTPDADGNIAYVALAKAMVS